MTLLSVLIISVTASWFYFLFQINLQSPLTMRVSYNDYKLYLSILESVSKQLNRAIKSEVSPISEDDIPDHDFDGKRGTVYFPLFFLLRKKEN